MSINNHIWIEKKWIKQQAELLLNCSYDLFDLKMDKWPWTLSVIYLWPQLLPSIQFKIKRAKKKPIKNKNQFNLVAYEIHFFLQYCDISGISFYDNRTGEVWRVHVNMEMLVQLFIHCYMSTTRAALLHYVLTRTRDFFLIKRVSLMSVDPCFIIIIGNFYQHNTWLEMGFKSILNYMYMYTLTVRNAFYMYV